ncbi:hypothetical protein [Thiohalophilus sp.]|uniref:hypothetical protein n=1 Tax=Thiohalophilus sp. TaxID=3028392 RepID=UPI002ACEBBC6|nr:hypothetical protein [Thiohalophilus sp.]MDZ7804333.1 hypothetical protein [Thiohalophilus sp.]
MPREDVQAVEIDAIKQDSSEIRDEMRTSITGVRSDLKELTSALHDLIRLDGELNRVADLTGRIGTEVDSLARLMRKEHGSFDARLRSLEVGQAGNDKSVGLFDDWVRYGGFVIVGLVVGGVVAKAAGV